MSEEKKDSVIKSTLEAAAGLMKEVPVYQDALQPAAKELGKSLVTSATQVGQSVETVTKFVNVALIPLKLIVWGYDKIEGFITDRVSFKLKDVPTENIVTPKLEIAGPVLESLRYAGEVEELREMYANLLANAMDKSTLDKIHPAFVEVIKNMAPEEAKILQEFSNERKYPLIDIKAKNKDDHGYQLAFRSFTHLHKICKLNVNVVPTYLDNLCRLKILEISESKYLTAPNMYEPLMEDLQLEKLKKKIEKADLVTDFDKKFVTTTSFGRRFVANVVKDKGPLNK